MSYDFRQYFERIETIGDLIINISELIGKGNDVLLNKTIERYQYAKESLAEVKSPRVIQDEHKRLVIVLGEWIQAIKVLISSKNENDFTNAVINQKQKEEEFVAITDLMVGKLTKM